MLSPDSEFHEKGGDSQIRYHFLFNRYKQLVISSLHLPRGRALLKLWNDYVFGTAAPARNGINNPDGSGDDNTDNDDDIFRGALQALQNATINDDNNAMNDEPTNDDQQPADIVLDSSRVDFDTGDEIEIEADRLDSDVNRQTTSLVRASVSLNNGASSSTLISSSTVSVNSESSAAIARRRTRPAPTKPPTRTTATRSQRSERGRGTTGRRRAVA